MSAYLSDCDRLSLSVVDAQNAACSYAFDYWVACQDGCLQALKNCRVDSLSLNLNSNSMDSQDRFSKIQGRVWLHIFLNHLIDVLTFLVSWYSEADLSSNLSHSELSSVLCDCHAFSWNSLPFSPSNCNCADDAKADACATLSGGYLEIGRISMLSMIDCCDPTCDALKSTGIYSTFLLSPRSLVGKLLASFAYSQS